MVEATPLKMKTAFPTALVPAVVTSALLALVFGPGDMLTLLVLFALAFVPCFSILLLFLRFGPSAAWSQRKQRLTIWALAAGTAALVGGVLAIIASYRWIC